MHPPFPAPEAGRPYRDPASGLAGIVQTALRQVRRAAGRLRAGTVAQAGFVAAIAWAFFGSLGLGLGTAAASPATARLWFAGEALIGGLTLLLLLLLGDLRGNDRRGGG